MKKLKIGFAGSTQVNFAGGAGGGKSKLFEQSVQKISDLSKKLDFDYYIYPHFLVTGDDATKARAAFEAEKVDFTLLQITTFSAGEIVINLAKVNSAFGLWGLPEPSTDGCIFMDSINSFCGLNMYSSIIVNYLKDFQIKHKWFYGNPNDDLFTKRFTITIKALSAIKKLKNSKVALVGGIAPGFNDLYFDERIGQKRLGIQIERNHEFSEIQQRAESYTAAELEKSKTEATTGFANIPSVDAKNLDTHLRYYKAYKDFSDEYGYDALGVSCWPKMKDASASLSCSVISQLNQNGLPAACEGDLPGAVSMLLQKYISAEPVTLMDLSGIDETDQSILMWHCGPSPSCYAGAGGACLQLSQQPTSADTSSHTGLIADMVFKPQKVTFMRITGEWDKLFLLDGEIINRQKPSPIGSRGWVESLRLNRRNISVLDLMNTILVGGMQHHYSMAASDMTEELMEVAAWLGIKPVEAIAYENYLQIGV